MHRRRFLQALGQSRLLSRPLWRGGALGAAAAWLGASTSAQAADACNCGNCPQCLQPTATPVAQPSADTPAIALYYGADIPVDDLRAFDWVVLEPDHALTQHPQIVSAFAPHTLPLAYVSVGEVDPERGYAARVPKAWTPAGNAAWKSRVIDQTAAGWPAFLREQIVQPLWNAGFRGFFLDTLDSYQLLAKTPEQRQQQAKALAETLRGLVAAFPGIRFIFNRGFELVDASLAPSVLGVAAESLYRGWDQANQSFVEVKPADRQWLLDRFAELRQRYGLRGIAIDYAAPTERKLARDTAKKIAAAGLIPYVTDPQLLGIGVGQIELVPRRTLLLHSCPTGDSPQLQAQSAHIYGAMPLEYHGLVPEYRFDGAAMPRGPLAGRYAAIVFYPDDSQVPGGVRELLQRARAEDVPVLILGQADADLLSEFGIKVGSDPLPAPIQVSRAAGTPNGEIIPLVSPSDTQAIDAGTDAQVWLYATGANGQRMDGAAITPWGGYALGNFGVFNLPGNSSTRWSIEPIAFIKAALRIGDDPMPNLATRTGRRAFFVHFDGDGWPNACDQPGSPLACEVLVKDFIEHYQVPTLASVIVGEISHEGQFPKLADVSQQWAKRMFALSYVQVGNHTWSHPFDWVMAEKVHARFPTAPGYQDIGNYLPLPDYTFSTASNVTEAQQWIEQKLCPPGKKCVMLLWPGDCNPPNDAVAMTYQAGMGNINGGGAPISRTNPSISVVWPMGIPKGDYFQVYAPCSNEENYTHNWRSAFFGFERVIESYQMTDTPRRLKPVDLYYHPYIVTKAAGAKSLHTVYRWALAQPMHTIYGHQYFESVLAWRRATVARRLDGGWRLRSDEALRQWAQPRTAAAPNLSVSRAVAGWNDHAEQRYLHAATGEAVVIPARSTPAPLPRLIDANADIVRWEVQPDGRISAQLGGWMPVRATLDVPPGWTLRAAGARVSRGAGNGTTVAADQPSLDFILARA